MTSRTASEVSNIEGTGNKRRRIPLACSACRARKSRCDGARPRCSACDELSFDCVYVQSASSSNVIIGKEYLASIEQRLKATEENILVLQANQRRSQRQLRFEGDDVGRPDESITTNNASREAPDGLDTSSVEVQNLVTLDDKIDGVGGVIFSVEEDCGFFGPSSNIAFNRHISRAVAQLSRTNQLSSNASDRESQMRESDIGIMSASRPSSPIGHPTTRQYNGTRNESPVNIYALPPEDRTRELIAQYFGDTGLLFPYIHEGTFWESYNEMKSSNFKRVRRSWLGLLNIVMALATSTTIDARMTAEKRARESDVYYQRAMGLCEKQIMRGASLEIVQFLLVMGQYLQGTQRSVETWAIHGLAIKAALQLGLHSAKASQNFSPILREFRKRTWFGCVVLDRTLSMTFGRPAAIPDSYVVLDLPCNIDLDPSEPINPQRDISLDFFNATITLYKIMWKVINTSYGGNIDSDNELSVVDSISRILQMEELLAEWERQLPPALALRHSTEVPLSSAGIDPRTPSLEKLRIILTLRHHNLRVLLHRPILVSVLDITGKTSQTDPQSASFLQSIGSNSVQICVQSSMEIISLVNIIVGSTGERRTWLGAWWFCLYYTFNAALVVFAALLIAQSQTINGVAVVPLSHSIPELQMFLLDAAVALRRLDTENRMVDRCSGYVEKLVTVLKALGAANSLSNTHGINSNPNGQPSFNGEEYQFNTDMFQTIPSAPTFNESPLGMDLGEFILEGDIDFINQLVSMGNGIGMNPEFEFGSQAAIGDRGVAGLGGPG